MKPVYAIAIAASTVLCCSSLLGADFSGARERTEAKIEHLKRTAALLERLEQEGPDEVAKALTEEDLDALLYSKEPALGQAVLNYCLSRFGQDLQAHAKDPESFRKAMEYLEAVRYRPSAEPFAHAVGKMTWKDDHAAIPPVCDVLKSIVFWREDGDSRGEIISQLLEDYSQNVHYIDGPAQALEAMGDEGTVIALVDIMEQTGDKDLKHRKSQVLTVIGNMMKPSYGQALARLGKTIRDASGQNAHYAMEIAAPFSSRDVDDALVVTATNRKAPVWTRGDAVRAIGKRKLARYRELIESIGREEDLHQAVAQALKDIGGPSSLPLLASYLDEPEMVRIYAAEAIGTILDKPWGADAKGVAAAMEWWKKRSEKSEQPDRAATQESAPSAAP